MGGSLMQIDVLGGSLLSGAMHVIGMKQYMVNDCYCIGGI